MKNKKLILFGLLSIFIVGFISRTRTRTIKIDGKDVKISNYGMSYDTTGRKEYCLSSKSPRICIPLYLPSNVIEDGSQIKIVKIEKIGSNKNPKVRIFDAEGGEYFANKKDVSCVWLNNEFDKCTGILKKRNINVFRPNKFYLQEWCRKVGYTGYFNSDICKISRNLGILNK